MAGRSAGLSINRLDSRFLDEDQGQYRASTCRHGQRRVQMPIKDVLLPLELAVAMS
jgi:hypothetical protein